MSGDTGDTETLAEERVCALTGCSATLAKAVVASLRPLLAAERERGATEAAATALEAAADRMPAFHDRDVPEWAITSACRWLKDRAAALRAVLPPESEGTP